MTGRSADSTGPTVAVGSQPAALTGVSVAAGQEPTLSTGYHKCAPSFCSSFWTV